MWPPLAYHLVPLGQLVCGKSSSLTCVYLQELCADLLYNPHSTEGDGDSDWAGAGVGAAADARAATLALCNAPPEEYVCVLTSGATGPPLSSNAEVVWGCNPCTLGYLSMISVNMRCQKSRTPFK